MRLKQIILLGLILMLAIFASACSGGVGEQADSSYPNETPDQAFRDGGTDETDGVTNDTDDSGGIGGSGRTANVFGPITAIDNTVTDVGSTITVKGIEWAFSEDQVFYDFSIPPSHKALKIGMVVYIYGLVNPDGATGKIDVVRVMPSLIGSIEAIDEDTIMIMKQQAVVTDQTIFDPDNVSPPSMSGLTVGEDVIVYGQLNSEKNLEASLIQKLATPPDDTVVSGLVVNVDSDFIQIGSLVIDIRDAYVGAWAFPQTDLSIEADISIEVGDYVLAKSFQLGGDLFFYEVILIGHIFEENEYLVLDGYVAQCANPKFVMSSKKGEIDFVIDDQTVFYDGLTPVDLLTYMDTWKPIRLKGTFKNGFIRAEEISLPPM